MNALGTSDLTLSIFLLYNLDALEDTVPTDLFDYLLMNIIDGVSLLEISKRSKVSYEKLRYWRNILLNELRLWIKDK